MPESFFAGKFYGRWFYRRLKLLQILQLLWRLLHQKVLCQGVLRPESFTADLNYRRYLNYCADFYAGKFFPESFTADGFTADLNYRRYLNYCADFYAGKFFAGKFYGRWFYRRLKLSQILKLPWRPLCRKVFCRKVFKRRVLLQTYIIADT